MGNEGNAYQDKYDYIVIGTGPAGFVSSIRAAQLGLKVAVIQNGTDMIGGACLHEGVIPAKSLIHSASILNAVKKNADILGIEIPDNKDYLAKMVEKSQTTITQMRKGIGGFFKKNGIDVISGHAQFLDNSNIEVIREDSENLHVSADNILIATGSIPKPLPDIPFDGIGVISSDEAIKLTEVPKKIVIVGGGAIGAEFASFFSIIGSEVIIVEFENSIIPTEDTDISTGLQRLFKKQGIKTYTSSKVTKVIKSVDNVMVHIRGEESEIIEECDIVLISTGRSPLTSSLGLDKAGVKTDDRGFIPVDDRMRTNIENIYAAGDVIPTPMLANVAFIEGEIAAFSAAGRVSEPIDYTSVPNVVYTEVQVASIGLTEEQAKSMNLDYSVGTQPLVGSFKSSINSARDGFIKVLGENSTGRLLGAHILAPEAAELIQVFVLAKKAGLSVKDIERTIPPNPTFTESSVDASKSVFGTTVRS